MTYYNIKSHKSPGFYSLFRSRKTIGGRANIFSIIFEFINEKKNDEENNSQRKTEEIHCIFNHINEEVSDRQSNAESNTNIDDILFIYSVSYPDAFS